MTNKEAIVIIEKLSRFVDLHSKMALDLAIKALKTQTIQKNNFYQYQTLGDIITRFCENKGWSVKDLASKLNVNVSTVYYWKKNEHKPYAKNVLNLSRCFDIEIEELIK